MCGGSGGSGDWILFEHHTTIFSDMKIQSTTDNREFAITTTTTTTIETNLGETDVGGLLTEALTADVHLKPSVLATYVHSIRTPHNHIFRHENPIDNRQSRICNHHYHHYHHRARN
jgi:hypothetical protein